MTRSGARSQRLLGEGTKWRTAGVPFQLAMIRNEQWWFGIQIRGVGCGSQPVIAAIYPAGNSPVRTKNGCLTRQTSTNA